MHNQRIVCPICGGSQYIDMDLVDGEQEPQDIHDEFWKLCNERGIDPFE